MCLPALMPPDKSSCSLTGVGLIILDPAQHVRYTGVSSATRGRMMGVVLNGPGIVFDPVAIRRVRSRQRRRAKPPEKSKGTPEPGGQTGSGEGRTGERE